MSTEFRPFSGKAFRLGGPDSVSSQRPVETPLFTRLSTSAFADYDTDPRIKASIEDNLKKMQYMQGEAAKTLLYGIEAKYDDFAMASITQISLLEHQLKYEIAFNALNDDKILESSNVAVAMLTEQFNDLDIKSGGDVQTPPRKRSKRLKE